MIPLFVHLWPLTIANHIHIPLPQCPANYAFLGLEQSLPRAGPRGGRKSSVDPTQCIAFMAKQRLSDATCIDRMWQLLSLNQIPGYLMHVLS